MLHIGDLQKGNNATNEGTEVEDNWVVAEPLVLLVLLTTIVTTTLTILRSIRL